MFRKWYVHVTNHLSFKNVFSCPKMTMYCGNPQWNLPLSGDKLLLNAYVLVTTVIIGQGQICFTNANGDAIILTASNIPGYSTQKRAKYIVKYTRFVMSNLFRNCWRRVQNKVVTKNNSLLQVCKLICDHGRVVSIIQRNCAWMK